ncbi:TetR/AcrR family transcriptional regulator [Burkholderia sp. PU8-34]
MSKRTSPGDLSRAKTPEGKALVRQAFIDAGRRLFANEQPSKVSLRRIAQEAGYSPASIYQYFPDYQALMLAIRELDLNEFAEKLEQVASRTRDPEERVRKLAKWSVKHWLAHLDEFDVLFSRMSKLGNASDEEPYGQSPTVNRALNVYYNAVDALFEAGAHPPIASRLAADTLIATTYGIVSFPRGTPTMAWSEPYQMAENAIDALVDSWLGAQ